MKKKFKIIEMSDWLDIFLRLFISISLTTMIYSAIKRIAEIFLGGVK